MPTDCRNTLQTIRSGMAMPRNQHEAVVVSEDEMFGVWLEHKVESGQMSRADADAAWKVYRNDVWPDDPEQKERLNELIAFALGNAANTRSGVDAVKLAVDFKGVGQYYVKSYAGKNYIIFKGWPNGRSLIRGTRYLADNPRIASMGIGRLGLKNAAKAGARITFVLLGAFRILQYLLDDKFTLTRLVGTLATDVTKIAASGLVSYVASGTLVAVSSGVVGPLAVAVIIGVGVGYGLELVDQEFKLTDRLVAEMERAITSIGQMPDILACRAKRAVEQSLLDAVDSAAEAILEALVRWGEREMRRFTQPRLLPGWSRF